jgi:hypothetical protein
MKLQMAIKVTIKDKDALINIPLDKFKTYLTKKGWAKKDDYNRMLANGSSMLVAELWTQGVWPKVSSVIVLPTKQTFTDYAARMSENLMTLERTENRSQLEIYADIIQKTITFKPNKIKTAKAVEKDIKKENKKVKSK